MQQAPTEAAIQSTRGQQPPTAYLPLHPNPRRRHRKPFVNHPAPPSNPLPNIIDLTPAAVATTPAPSPPPLTTPSPPSSSNRRRRHHRRPRQSQGTSVSFNTGRRRNPHNRGDGGPPQITAAAPPPSFPLQLPVLIIEEYKTDSSASRRCCTSRDVPHE
jgi:hypothetical protein